MDIGSPPRVRGTAFPTSHGSPLMGITPACAGNSYARFCARITSGDHPRVCGEQSRSAYTWSSAIGSPPRVRGTDPLLWLNGFRNGITPACAGNSPVFLYTRYPHRDHPRVCGEQVVEGVRQLGKLGSPPRVRGTVFLFPNSGLSKRITPACAGNSNGGTENAAVFKDHPRVCGEQTVDGLLPEAETGSPPRVRGTASLHGFLALDVRITPACAGNSIYSDVEEDSYKDHPRVCGEQAVEMVMERVEAGSPPRVRGTVEDVFDFTARGWITPACAGNSEPGNHQYDNR